MSRSIKYWIEAMRLRTLPVSVAGVVMAAGLALLTNKFRPLPAAICLIVAILAQIASNFANEYYDFKSGLDKPGREGPRRGVTEGDISPRAMLIATYLTLGLACAFGLSLVYWGGWWMIPAGIAIALGALAYSTGPFPLSHHALGEVAVVIFFGIAPVCLTYYIQAADCPGVVWGAAVAVGLLGANVLIVNNYRDIDDDKAVGKTTLAVVMGRRATRMLYVSNALLAVILLTPLWLAISVYMLIVPGIYLLTLPFIYMGLTMRSGANLTPLLGASSMAMFLLSLCFAIGAACIN